MYVYVYMYLHRRRGVERTRLSEPPGVQPRGIFKWKTLTSNTFAIRFK